jgi:integrase
MAIWKHQGKYRYGFQYKGVRYGNSGYSTKREAREAEADHKKRIRARKSKNAKFVSLCQERKNELKLRCTHNYFDENEKLIDNLIDRRKHQNEIERKDVKQFLNGVAKRWPSIANKYLRFIRAMFNFDITEGMVDYDPSKGLKFYPVHRSINYIPPNEDIGKILNSAKPLEKDYLLVVAFTMARINEINRLKWDDVYENHLILKTRKSRNSDLVDRIIPLTKPLKEVMERIPRKGKFVFINRETGTR